MRPRGKYNFQKWMVQLIVQGSSGIKREGSAPYPTPRMGSREAGYNAVSGPGIQDLGPQGPPGLPLGSPAYSLQPQHGQMQQISLDQRRGPPQFGPGGGGVGSAPASLGLQVITAEIICKRNPTNIQPIRGWGE